MISFDIKICDKATNVLKPLAIMASITEITKCSRGAALCQAFVSQAWWRIQEAKPLRILLLKQIYKNRLKHTKSAFQPKFFHKTKKDLSANDAEYNRKRSLNIQGR